MKKTFVFSGLIAFAVSLSSLFIYDNFKTEDQPIAIHHISSQDAKTISNPVELTSVPDNFTEVAEDVLASVVHIKSTHVFEGNSRNFEYRSLPDPFRDFFDDNFQEFFGPGLKFDHRGQKNDRSEKMKPPTRVGTGSGVIINENGYIVTNNHVIAEADDIEVTLHDNRTYKAMIIGTDPSTDLALLQIKEKDLSPLPLVDSDNVKIGEWVLAVGNPMGLNSTVTAGIVSAKGRNINILKDKYAIENFIQTDAAINPGNSGGALVNLNGGLVGINTAIASPTGAYAGYGFAVPANIVNKVVEDLLKYGVVQRGVLGVMIRTIDGNLARDKDLRVTQGVLVDSLLDNSAAASAGVKSGDVITAVNGVEIKTTPELQGMIARFRPGEKVDLTILRGDKEMTLDVTLKNRDGNIDLAEKGDREMLKVLGAEFQDIDVQLAKKLNIHGGVRVVKLYPGKIRKYTQMREGFIITRVDGKKVTSTEALSKALEGKKGGVMLEGVYDDLPGQYYYAFGL